MTFFLLHPKKNPGYATVKRADDNEGDSVSGGKCGDRLPPCLPCDEFVDSADPRGDLFEFLTFTLNQLVVIRALDNSSDVALNELRALLKRYETRRSDPQIKGNSNAVVKETTVSEVNSTQRKKQKQDAKETSKELRRSSMAKTKAPAQGTCQSCGGSRDECSLRDWVCHSCQKKEHIAKVCPSGKEVQNNALHIFPVLSPKRRNRTYVDVAVNGRMISSRANSRTDVFTIRSSTWKSIDSPSLQPYGDVCTQARGKKLRYKGFFPATLSCDGCQCREPFIVQSSGSNNLLRGRALKLLKIVLWRSEVCKSAIAAIGASTPSPQNASAFKFGFPPSLRRSSGAVRVQSFASKSLINSVPGNKLWWRTTEYSRRRLLPFLEHGL